MEELSVRTFVAEETRVGGDGEMWGKSYHMLDEDIWFKQDEKYYVVKFMVDDSIGYPGLGDYLRLRYVTDHNIASAWFQVTSIILDGFDMPKRCVLYYRGGELVDQMIHQNHVFLNYGTPGVSRIMELESLKNEV